MRCTCEQIDRQTAMDREEIVHADIGKVGVHKNLCVLNSLLFEIQAKLNYGGKLQNLFVWQSN